MGEKSEIAGVKIKVRRKKVEKAPPPRFVRIGRHGQAQARRPP